MRDKLEKIIAAYEELEQKMVDPAVVSDPKEYARIAKEHADQAALVAKAREYLQALDDIEAAKVQELRLRPEGRHGPHHGRHRLRRPRRHQGPEYALRPRQ